MKLLKPFHNKHYYEAYSDGELIGYYPNEDRLIFSDWLQDMQDTAIYGCTRRMIEARQARLNDLMKGVEPKPIEQYLKEDTRPKIK